MGIIMKKTFVHCQRSLLRYGCFLWLALLLSLGMQAQAPSGERQTIAFFLPLYLDSAFDASNTYRFGKQFPKYLNPGLEFYEGAQLALDSLHKSKALLDVQVYDTKASKAIADIVSEPKFQSVDLIIGYVNSVELKQLAAVAKTKSIPFININLPNDGGVTDNASFVILNTTIESHCQSLYKYLQRNHATQSIVYFRKAGSADDKLRSYFSEAEKKTAGVPFTMRNVRLQDGFSTNDLTPWLDSTQQTTCVIGSLDEGFTKELLRQFSLLQGNYPMQVVGMPTLDGIRELSQPAFRNLDVTYSTPFYYPRTDRLSNDIQTYFKNNLFARPSDMVFRGYEVTARFARLLLERGSQISGSIGEKKYKVFTDFDIQPVIRQQGESVLDYFENKHLYFVRKSNGNTKLVQ
jgi:hypothetical protein